MKEKQRPAPQIHWHEEKKTLTLTGEPVLELRLRWPELQGQGRHLRRINRYYTRLAGAWRQRWEKEGYLTACFELCACREQSRPFHAWKVSLDGSCETPRVGYCSIQTDATEVRCDGRPLYTRSCALWNLAQGAPVPLQQELGQRFWRRKLLERTLQAAQQQAGAIFFSHDYPQQIKKWFSPERFRLTAHGLEIFYPQCTIAAGAEGIVSLLLPQPAGVEKVLAG